jgi:hypothetical protein
MNPLRERKIFQPEGGHQKRTSNVKFTLRLIKNHATKKYGEVEVQHHHSWPRHQMELGGQLHALASVHPEKERPVPIT